jgi:hypothetical protein
VELIAILLAGDGGLHGGRVRGDRLLPIADAREDVRRHVLRMRRGGRDLGVQVGRLQAFFGDRRIVVEMDQVVRDARMLRLALPDRPEDRRSLELLCVGLVGRRGRRIQRDGIGDLCLVVIRVFRRQLLHRAEIGSDALGMGELVVVDVHQGECIDVVALPFGLGADRLRLLNRGETRREIGRGDRPMRIVELRQRNAPIGHTAFGIGLRRLLEDLAPGAIPERMLIAHAAVEAALRDLVARRLEMHLAELLVA